MIIPWCFSVPTALKYHLCVSRVDVCYAPRTCVSKGDWVILCYAGWKYVRLMFAKQQGTDGLGQCQGPVILSSHKKPQQSVVSNMSWRLCPLWSNPTAACLGYIAKAPKTIDYFLSPILIVERPLPVQISGGAHSDNKTACATQNLVGQIFQIWLCWVSINKSWSTAAPELVSFAANSQAGIPFTSGKGSSKTILIFSKPYRLTGVLTFSSMIIEKPEVITVTSINQRWWLVESYSLSSNWPVAAQRFVQSYFKLSAAFRWTWMVGLWNSVLLMQDKVHLMVTSSKATRISAVGARSVAVKLLMLQYI